MIASDVVRDVGVFVGFKHFAPGMLAAAMTVAIGGCASNDFDTKAAWFSKPLDLFGSKGGYTYSNLDEVEKSERPITANDLVDANGGCPAAPSAAPSSAPPQQTGATGAHDGVALSSDLSSLISGGVALSMSECEVVTRLGRPNAVNLGKNPNGSRSAILTYNGGSRPGVYRFEAGRLVEMDRLATASASPGPAKKMAKKKPGKPKELSSAADKT